MNEKLPIYQIHYNGFKYYYSPLFSLILSGAPDADFIGLGWLWKLMNLFFLWRLWQITTSTYLGTELNSFKKNLLVLFSFIACFHLLYDTFHYVQFSIFLIYMSVEGLHQIMNKKKLLLGTALIGLAINIKVMPIVFIPYLIYRKEYLSTLMITGWVITFLALPALFIGWDYNWQLLGGWWKNINPMETAHVLDVNEAGLHSISTLVSTLFSAEGGTPDITTRRHIMVLSFEQIKYIILFLRILLISSVLLVLRWTPFQKETNKEKLFSEWAIILLIAALIFPHQQIYGFALSLPVMIIMVHHFIMLKDVKKQVSFWVFLFSILIINLAFYFGFARNFLSHYKTMTYGVILLLILFLDNRWIIFKPKKVVPSTSVASSSKTSL